MFLCVRPFPHQRVLLYGLPALATAFLFIYHIGLGQPGLLRGSLLGTVFFYVSTFYCYYRVGAPDASKRWSCSCRFSVWCLTDGTAPRPGRRRRLHEALPADAPRPPVVRARPIPVVWVMWAPCYGGTSTADNCRCSLRRPAVIIPFIVFYPFIYVYVIANNAFGGSGGSTSSTNKLIIRCAKNAGVPWPTNVTDAANVRPRLMALTGRPSSVVSSSTRPCARFRWLSSATSRVRWATRQRIPPPNPDGQRCHSCLLFTI